MSAPELRRYRVSLVGFGASPVWVTAESRTSACSLAKQLWRQSRCAVLAGDAGPEYVEILDAYAEGGAA
jgi:hypothetical protein